MSLIDEITKALDEATHGPWFAHATDDSDFANARYVSDREGPFVHDNKRSLTNDRREGENIIAVTLWQRSPFIDEKDGREDANAHLIAHAPEWLRLLVEQNKELLARNEELQRRVELLDKVYERARDLLYDGIYGGEYYDTLLDTVARDRSTGKNTRAVALFDALTPLDGPKGQDDD